MYLRWVFIVFIYQESDYNGNTFLVSANAINYKNSSILFQRVFDEFHSFIAILQNSCEIRVSPKFRSSMWKSLRLYSTCLQNVGCTGENSLSIALSWMNVEQPLFDNSDMFSGMVILVPLNRMLESKYVWDVFIIGMCVLIPSLRFGDLLLHICFIFTCVLKVLFSIICVNPFIFKVSGEHSLSIDAKCIPW